MSNVAFVQQDFHCPACHAVLEGSNHPEFAAFAWGYCSGPGFPGRRPYRVGDPLLWGSLANGNIPAWTCFQSGGVNVGDPAVRRLIAVDLNSWRSLNGRKCPACGIEFGAVAVEVEDSRITAASIIASNCPFMSAEYHVFQADGPWLPMPDWEDHRFVFAREAGSISELPLGEG